MNEENSSKSMLNPVIKEGGTFAAILKDFSFDKQQPRENNLQVEISPFNSDQSQEG
jgi:hypothetical protein